MRSVRVRKLTNLTVEVDPREDVNIKQPECNNSVKTPSTQAKYNPGKQENHSTNHEPVIISFHYHP